jgi:flagellar assembly factor FliW
LDPRKEDEERNRMKIETTRFGTVEVAEDKIITMPNGLLGFQDKRSFCLFQHKEDSPFFWYQSTDDPSLAFVITSPFLFKPDYQVDAGSAIDALRWEGDNPLDCYVLVSIPKGMPEKMTANLIGPIIVNTERREAVQIVLVDDTYSHKYPLTTQAA